MSREIGSPGTLPADGCSSPLSAPAKEQVGAKLEDAINTAPVEQLRMMLRDFVKKHAGIKEAVSNRLLTPMSPLPSIHTLKRKAFETCCHCDKDYAVLENVVGSCVYHEGERQPDYESSVFDDCYEEWEEPDPDDKEFEHGFIWSCCDQHQPAAGCVVTKHVPTSANEQRARPKAKRA